MSVSHGLLPGLMLASPRIAPMLTICAAWALAHLSVLRRQIAPWRPGAVPIRLRLAALRSPLS